MCQEQMSSVITVPKVGTVKKKKHVSSFEVQCKYTLITLKYTEEAVPARVAS